MNIVYIGLPVTFIAHILTSNLLHLRLTAE